MTSEKFPEHAACLAKMVVPRAMRAYRRGVGELPLELTLPRKSSEIDMLSVRVSS